MPGHSQASLGQSPGSWCTRFCCALQESISQSYVSSGSSLAALMATSSKRTYAIHTPRAPDPAAGHCRPTPPPETPGHSQASLGQSLVRPLLLSPGSWCAQVLFVPSKGLFPQCCVSSGGSMVGLMVIPSKRVMPYPGLLHPEPLPL